MLQQSLKLSFRGSYVMLPCVISFCLLSTCNAGMTTTGLYVHKEKDWIDRGLDILHGKWDDSEKEVTVFGVTAGIGSANTYTQEERDYFVFGVGVVGLALFIGAFCWCCSLCCQLLFAGKRRSTTLMV